MRQNIYLRHRKASSPVSNALGSLIFLGTPFLVKRWNSLQKALFCFSIVVESLIAGAVLGFFSLTRIFRATSSSSPCH